MDSNVEANFSFEMSKSSSRLNAFFVEATFDVEKVTFRRAGANSRNSAGTFPFYLSGTKFCSLETFIIYLEVQLTIATTLY